VYTLFGHATALVHAFMLVRFQSNVLSKQNDQGSQLLHVFIASTRFRFL